MVMRSSNRGGATPLARAARRMPERWGFGTLGFGGSGADERRLEEAGDDACRQDDAEADQRVHHGALAALHLPGAAGSGHVDEPSPHEPDGSGGGGHPGADIDE